MTDVTAAGRARPPGRACPSLHVVATGVDADTADLVQGTAEVAAEQVTGTAVVSYDDAAELIDLLRGTACSDVTFSEDDGALRRPRRRAWPG